MGRRGEFKWRHFAGEVILLCVPAAHCHLRRFPPGAEDPHHGDFCNRAAADFLEHTLFTTDIMAALEISCRASGSVRLIKQREIVETLLPEATRAEARPFKWAVTVRWRGRDVKSNVEPDQVFGLEFVNDPPPNRVWFFLETDTGTETVVPETETLKRSSFLQKAARYGAVAEVVGI